MRKEKKGKGIRGRREMFVRKLTSAEHFATAAAKVSIGRVRPGIMAVLGWRLIVAGLLYLEQVESSRALLGKYFGGLTMLLTRLEQGLVCKYFARARWHKMRSWCKAPRQGLAKDLPRSRRDLAQIGDLMMFEV